VSGAGGDRMVVSRLARGGETFALRSWKVEGARTALVVHHGLGEHGGRYRTFVDGLAGLPLSVVAFDLRGHGESSGTRGHADGLAGLASDFDALLPTLLDEVGAERAIVLGHSLGAASVLTWLQSPGFRVPASVVGLCVSAPPVVVPRTLSVRVKHRAGRLLRRLRPAFTLANEIPPEAISSDPEQVRRYGEDPFVHDRISAALGVSILESGPALVAGAARITLPALVWQGSEDRIAHPDGARAVFAALGSTDKQLRVFEGWRHECHHETAARTPELWALLRGWLEPRL
jgi:acylglycerol lipase